MFPKSQQVIIAFSVKQCEVKWIYEISTQTSETVRLQIRKIFVSKSDKAKTLPHSQNLWQLQKKNL